MRNRIPVAMALALFVSIPGAAKTPDGWTPAEETVCDEYHGAAYGLCVSYCEARDCDDPRSRAAERACAITAATFRRRTGHPLVCQPSVCEDLVARHDLFTLTQLPGNVLDDERFPENADTYPPAGAEITVHAEGAPEDVSVSLQGDVDVDRDEQTAWETVEFEYDLCCTEDGEDPVCTSAIVVITGC